MLRRHSRTRSETHDRAESRAGDDPPGSVPRWSHLAESWDGPEEERVALWLTAKGRIAATGVDPALSAAEFAGTAHTAAPAGRRVPGDAEAGGYQAQRERVRSLVESQIEYLEEQRGRLSDALDAERAEAERVRQELVAVRSQLESEIARLDDQRRGMLAAVEMATAAAERAVEEEREARAALRAASAEADEAQSRHLEEWVALESGLSELRERRRRRLAGHADASPKTP